MSSILHEIQNALEDSSYELSKEEKATCLDFAEKEAPTVEKIKANRGQLNTKRSIEQSYEGKCAEIAVSQILNFHDLNCTVPDFEITNDKTHGVDLEVRKDKNKIRLAIKNQHAESGRLFGESWIFEKAYINAIKNQPWEWDDHLLILCTFDEQEVFIKKVISFKTLMTSANWVFKPLKKNLPSKCAIYLEDVEGIKGV